MEVDSVIINGFSNKSLGHLKEWVEFMYRNSSEMIPNRSLTLECGKKAHMRLLELLAEQVQLMQFEEKQIITKTGDILKLGPIKIQKVFLPYIGYAVIKYNPNFDYDIDTCKIDPVSSDMVIITQRND